VYLTTLGLHHPAEQARLAVAELRVELSVRFLQQWFAHHRCIQVI
jgi:hypothetical protein